jgi:hypothetical protein
MPLALELYAALCGVIHGFTTQQSNLSRRGDWGNVLYGWEATKTKGLAAALMIFGRHNYAAVGVEVIIISRQVIRKP